MAFLQTENLSFAYPDNGTADSGAKVLDNINITAERGELILICGSSGSGKTTLLRLLKPVIAPFGRRSGRIIYDGVDISALDSRRHELVRAAVSEIGYVGQDPNAGAVTDTVIAELAYLPENTGLPRGTIMRRIAELSAYFGLEHIIDRKISELSAGQKQLVQLAGVMSVSPALLLLDEPTAQLDPHSAEVFRNIILKIRAELGTAVIICEHDIKGLWHHQQWRGGCDRVLYLENGRQSFFLPPAQAAERLCGTPAESALPCCYRLSAAMGLDKPLKDSAAARSFLLENKPAPLHEKEVYQPDKEIAVRLKNIRFGYTRHGREVLAGVTLSVPKGSITAVFGANGTGKSTLLKMIAGVYRPIEGSAEIFGKRVKNYHAAAMLPQDPHLILTEKTLFEDIKRGGGGNIPDIEGEIMRLAEALGLSAETLGRYHYDVSGGELQRAALMKLLIKKPRLLLLDEPEKGLDCENKMRLTELLKRFAAEGGTVIFVTHDAEFAAETADSAVMMFGGICAVHEPINDFLSGNELFTTEAARIARGIIEGCVTAGQLIDCCRRGLTSCNE
jgi:energy-coupling factor transport system ATP-binding protein